MSVFRKEINRIEISPNIFEIKYEVKDSGSCQCFKDCDCYKKKNDFLYFEYEYTYTGAVNAGNKEKRFNSLKGCQDSYAHYLNKKLKQ